MNLTVDVPIVVKNPTNWREHWGTKAKRVKKQRSGVGLALKLVRPEVTLFKTLLNVEPLTVTLTRVYGGRQRAMDDDGAVASLKHVRDEVAAYFHINDNDPRITWRYAQAKGKPGVRILFEVAPC